MVRQEPLSHARPQPREREPYHSNGGRAPHLAEVEVAPDTKSWLVTFSYSIPGESEENPASPLALRQFLKQSPRRKLRVVTIDKEGAFRSLKVPS